MEQSIKETNEAIKQINMLSDTISLHQKIYEVQDNQLFHKIIEEIKETDQLIETSQNILENGMAKIRKEYDEVMCDLRETESEILKYLIKVKKQKIEEVPKTPLNYGHQLQVNSSTSTQKDVHRSALKQVQLKFENLLETPTNATPSGKKVNLPNFEVRITPQQFESIPKYMRGRTSCDELQHFLDYVIVPCFQDKYKLLSRSRAAVQHSKDFELWKTYHLQISYVKGRYFITAGDISRKLERMIDKKLQNYLIMIRHMGILQEQRVASQIICYMWATAI